MSQRPKGEADATPAMKQYHRFKQQHPDCVLFFRMGDFYEMFHEDAKLAHKVLGVTLTQRTEGVPMAGVPFHAVEGYLRRMILAGYRVAVCDQVEDPAQAKGVVQRDVTRVVTPGTLTDEMLLDEGTENPLAAVVFEENPPAKPGAETGRLPGAFVAWAELSTGAFSVAHFRGDELVDELARIRPRELLYLAQDSQRVPEVVTQLAQRVGAVPTGRPGWQFRQEEAVETLRRQFGVQSLSGYGFQDNDPLLGPAAAVVAYLNETQKGTGYGVQGRETGDDQSSGASTPYPVPRTSASLSHLRPPRRFERSEYLIIDQTSLHSLEVEQTMRSGSIDGSLLGVIQGCVTPMGKRTLRRWLCYPLCHRQAIEGRQRVVGAMVEDSRFLGELRDLFEGVQDVERIAGRIAVGRATPRDLVALGGSARQAVALAKLLVDRPAVRGYYDVLIDVSVPLAELGHRIGQACVEGAPAHLREGGLFRDGYDAQLDEYRGLQRDSHSWLARYQKQLIDETGINSLKVGFNKVFGYYIELTAAHQAKAPTNWSRKQTLKNAERFITQELKQFEEKVLSAESRAIAREQALFGELCTLTQSRLDELNRFATAAAELDVLGCFARRAVKRRYVRPTIVDEPVLHVRAGRHPVLEEILGDRFVPNDVEMGTATENPSDAGTDGESATLNPSSLALITGPNMAGKSTYIRQTALIVLLAHTGSFVPADEATIGLCDRIFTRIGASDELHAGQSTFMVEMTETANICHHATAASLVILDEIGRGTSTLDGLSLAWAIAEFLAQRGCRTLFATHYHELTDLAERYENVANLNVTVREWADQIVFLHRIVPGATDRSYGIHVAKIAGLPGGVVKRAQELLGQLSVHHGPAPGSGSGGRSRRRSSAPANQMGLFAPPPPSVPQEHPLVDEMRQIDLASLNPMQAFDLLRQWQQRLGDGQG